MLKNIHKFTNAIIFLNDLQILYIHTINKKNIGKIIKYKDELWSNPSADIIITHYLHIFKIYLKDCLLQSLE